MYASGVKDRHLSRKLETAWTAKGSHSVRQHAIRLKLHAMLYISIVAYPGFGTIFVNSGRRLKDCTLEPKLAEFSKGRLILVSAPFACHGVTRTSVTIHFQAIFTYFR